MTMEGNDDRDENDVDDNDDDDDGNGMDGIMWDEASVSLLLMFIHEWMMHAWCMM
jgi:hypothetical protein